MFTGDATSADALAARALQQAEQLGDIALKARALSEYGSVQLWESPYVAEATLRLAEPLARRLDDWRTLTRIHLVSGHCWQVAGEWAQSRWHRELGIAAAERAGATERINFLGRWVLTFTCLQLGAWEDGRAAARRAAELDPTWKLRAQPGPAYLAWLEGRPTDAQDTLRTYVGDCRERNDIQGLLTGLFILADLSLQLDKVGEAVAIAQDGLAILQHTHMWSVVGMVAGPLAELSHGRAPTMPRKQLATSNE